MSRTTRRSFRIYRYEEADTFATYLSEMAAQGWYLKKLGFGMLFEKGEPSETVYDVQVFPKGQDGDHRPEDDALEMAEYCEKAGWHLVDGQGKFVVFRQTTADALPIITQEEKYDNIRRSVRRQILSQLLLVLVGILDTFLIVDWDPETYLFNNWYMGATLMMASFGILSIIRLILLTRNCRRWKAELEAGNIPFYGSLGRDGHTTLLNGSLPVEILLLTELVVMVLSSLSYRSDPRLMIAILVGVILLPVLISLLIGVLTAEFKPSRETTFIIALIVLFIGLFVIAITPTVIDMIFTETTFFDDLEENFAESDSEYNLDELPLQITDYLEDSRLNLSYQDINGRSSVMGNQLSVDLDYNNYNVSLSYNIITCRFDWEADLIWSYEIHEAKKRAAELDAVDWYEDPKENFQSSDLSEELSAEERSALWNSDEAVAYWYTWYIRKGNKVITITFPRLPDAEQIQRISKKLGF